MRLFLTMSYLGTGYHGWQVQTNAVTVQQTLQDAIEAIFGSRLPVTGCSRTDSGVHAKMYCCHIDCPENTGIPPERVPAALNANLPQDVAVRECRIVPSDFHARYAVKAKTYEYTVLNTPCRDPFLNAFAWHVRASMDVSAMKQASRLFEGTHDFAGFQSAGSSVEDTVRTVMAAEVRQNGRVITLSITANGFLYNMVRIIAGTLVDVGLGVKKPEDIPDIIQSRERGLAGKTAPAQGLALVQVEY